MWGLLDFPGSASGKEPTCQRRLDVRDVDLIPGSGRSSGGGHSNLPSCLENPMVVEPGGLQSHRDTTGVLSKRVTSVVSDSVWPHRCQPTRLPRPWDSPGKNTGVGCHFLLQWVKVKSESEVAQSCLTLSDPVDCSLPGSSVHGIFQARVLEWGAIAFSHALTHVRLIRPFHYLFLNSIFWLHLRHRHPKCPWHLWIIFVPSSLPKGNPKESCSLHKQQQLARAAEIYMLLFMSMGIWDLALGSQKTQTALNNGTRAALKSQTSEQQDYKVKVLLFKTNIPASLQPNECHSSKGTLFE